jgi:hypothetical protein
MNCSLRQPATAVQAYIIELIAHCHKGIWIIVNTLKMLKHEYLYFLKMEMMFVWRVAL